MVLDAELGDWFEFLSNAVEQLKQDVTNGTESNDVYKGRLQELERFTDALNLRQIEIDKIFSAACKQKRERREQQSAEGEELNDRT